MLSIDSYSPPVQTSRLKTSRGDIFVVRDDLLKGGTKQRALIPYLQREIDRGHDTFIYATPFAGFAQVALSSACRDLGMKALIFAEQDPTQSQPLARHEFTKLAEQNGAEIMMCETLADAEKQATLASREHPRGLKIPLGFNVPEFREELRRAVQKQWQILSSQLPALPRNLWIPVGSGTLAKVLQTVVPKSVQLRCVNVRVLPESDPRIMEIGRFQNATCVSAFEEFAEPCKESPPVPSNLHYDAKLWSFIQVSACAGDLWWNVAR